MKTTHKRILFFTIYFAFMLSGAAAGAGAGSQGLTLILTLVVSLGSLLYTVIVGGMLCIIENLERKINAKNQMLWEAEYRLAKYERDELNNK